MKFYLDKDLAIKGIAKCIAVSEMALDAEEILNRKKYFNVKNILVYEGEDIPHKFKYNFSKDNIEEFVKLENISNISEKENVAYESDFIENAESDGNQYFYIDKEYADLYNKSQIIAVFDKPLKNPLKYFGKEVYSHKGYDMPYYITIELGVVREATEYEKYKRNQRKLDENEVILEKKKEIVLLNDGQYIGDNEEVITVECPKEYIKFEWSKETKKWIDTTTSLDKANNTYRDYLLLDTPLNLARLEKKGLRTEYEDMMNKLFDIIPQLESSKEIKEIDIPEPSKPLKEFKEQINKIGG